VVKGHRAEENQVSSTSSSWVRSDEAQPWQVVGSSTETMTVPQSRQYQAGMRCPHQIWRDTHQSRRFSIQLK
jgi:hypothetical protein